MPAAIIAGTLVYEIPGMELNEKIVSTPYGEALVYKVDGIQSDVVFLPRHGITHDTPPHQINYRANLKALEQLGVKRVLAVNAVGSINKEIAPLDLALLSDFIDFTSNREATFFEGGEQGVKHVDVSIPYCPYLRKKVLQAAEKRGVPIHPEAVYVCTNGPRLESPAEIKMFDQLGGDVVGMTGIPEAVLAKELDLCYASVAFSINWAAGFQEKVEFTTDTDGLQNMKKDLLDILLEAIASSTDSKCCID